MKNFRLRLSALQEELKAPKNLYNSFGKYKYRNAEGILEAVKPLLIKHNLLLFISDDVIMVGDRYYIKAQATVCDTDSDESVTVSAMARESLDKKGMDDSQITGTASSYARKYALNGLFLLDDTKDADTDEYHNQNSKSSKESEQRAPELINAEQIGKMKIQMLRTGVTEEYLCKHYQVNTMNDMTQEQWKNAMAMFEKTPDKKKD